MNYSLVRKVQKPYRGTPRSAGMDLFVPEFTDAYLMSLTRENPNAKSQALVEPQRKVIMVRPHGQVKLPTGVRVEVPENHILWVANKGSTSWSPTLTKLAEIIDEDFTGEVFITVFNYSDYPLEIRQGQPLVQLVCVPVLIESWNEVPDEQMHSIRTQRGAGSMGSTTPNA